MFPSLDLDDLETAIKVIESKNFTWTGARTHKHQTTVSRCMQRVERAVGTELVDRKARPVRPTKAGKVIAYWGGKGLDDFARGFTEIERTARSSRVVLDVGYTSYLDLEVLAGIQNACTAADTGFSQSEHSSSTSEVIDSVLARRWDCGFIIAPAATGRLVGVPIYQEPFGLLVASDHPLARRKKVSIGDLRDTPLVLPAKERNTGFRAWFVSRCGAEGVKLKLGKEVGNPREARFLASQHAGVALMPKSASKELPKGGTVFRPFAEDDLYAEIQLVFRDEPLSPSLAGFVDAMLRMRDRLGRKNLREEPIRVPPFPRPLVKPWTRPRNSRHETRAFAAGKSSQAGAG
jgi:DNA-binding transcriptional LysR family regulator